MDCCMFGNGLENVLPLIIISLSIVGIVSSEGLVYGSLPHYQIGLRFAISRESFGKLEALSSVIRDCHAK